VRSCTDRNGPYGHARIAVATTFRSTSALAPPRACTLNPDITVPIYAASAHGADRVGIRISPYGAFNHMGAFEGIDEQFTALVQGMSDLGLVYLHLVDHSSMGSPSAPDSLRATLRATFTGAFIASGGFDRAKAEATRASNAADLIAFGRVALANPDLVARLQHDWPLNAPDFATFYTPGEKGYTDYPTHSARSSVRTS